MIKHISAVFSSFGTRGGGGGRREESSGRDSRRASSVTELVVARPGWLPRRSAWKLAERLYCFGMSWVFRPRLVAGQRSPV